MWLVARSRVCVALLDGGQRVGAQTQRSDDAAADEDLAGQLHRREVQVLGSEVPVLNNTGTQQKSERVAEEEWRAEGSRQVE